MTRETFGGTLGLGRVLYQGGVDELNRKCRARDDEIDRLTARIAELEKRLKKLADATDEETISRGAVEVSLEDRYRDRAAHRRLENAYISALCATSEAVRKARTTLEASGRGGGE